MIALGDHGDAARREPVLQVENRQIVSWNDARGKNHRVAFAEADIGMLARGNARERSARLALAAGAEIKHAVYRQARRIFFRDDARKVLEITGVARSLH